MSSLGAGWPAFSWEAASHTYLMQEAHEVAEDGIVVLWEAPQNQAAVGHPQAALHTCNGMRLLAGVAQSQGQPSHVALLSTLVLLPGSFLLCVMAMETVACWEAGQ